MNKTVVTSQQGVPNCFAKMWDQNDPECAGGADADFTHPRTGLHVREQCTFFQACGTRTQALRTQNFVPLSQVVRPSPNPAVAVAGPPQTFADFLKQQQAAHVETQRLQAMTSQRPPTQTVMQQQLQNAAFISPHAAQHPAPMYQLNYMMPGYLSVPELRMPGESVWSVLLREIFRSMFKAFGHAVSHFFDVRHLKEHEAQKEK